MLVKGVKYFLPTRSNPMLCRGRRWTHLNRVHAFDGISELHGGSEEDALCWWQIFNSTLQIIHLRAEEMNYEQVEHRVFHILWGVCITCNKGQWSCMYLKLSPPPPRRRSHLIAEEFVQVSQLVGVGDLTLQRRVALQRPRGPADSNGRVSLDPLIALVWAVVGLWRVVGQGDCSQTGEVWHY